jgi:photosystem II stability/assembly factor-like uncharacterized protein
LLPLVLLTFLATAATASAQAGVWFVNGPEGGTIYCLVADPTNPSTLYAGTRRGVSKSTDGGLTWFPLGTGIPAVQVATIAIDPSAPSTLYAGTLTPSGVASVGIFKSTDAGATWAAVNNGLIDTVTGLGPVDVEALAVVPGSPGTLLAGTRLSDIFVTTDAGQSWDPVTQGGYYPLALEVSAFQFLPSDPMTVYAASTEGFIRSTDGGNSWYYFGDLGAPIFTLVLDPANPNTLYAGSDAGYGIFKSIDGGSHFTQINKNLPLNQNSSGSYSPLIRSLVLDPDNPGTLYAGSYGNGLFKSTDAGASWSAAGNGMRNLFVSSLGFSPGPTLLAGTFDSGVYRSTDEGQSWSMSSAGIHESTIYDLAADPSASGALYAATFDGVKASDDGGATWRSADSGLPLAAVASLALVPSAGTLFAGTLGGGLLSSADGGASWSAVSGLSEQYVSSIAVDPNDSSTLYAGSSHPYDSSHPERVFKSTDAGKTWTQTGLNGQSFSIDFIVVSPARSSQVIAGSSNTAGYFQSLDGGQTWSTIATASNCGGVNGVLFDAPGSTIYLAGSGGVCKSADGGTTWTSATIGYLSSVQALLLDPSDHATLYAAAAPAVSGGTGGVFRSTDAGQTWLALGAGLPPDVSGHKLAANLGGGRALYLGTQGEGVAALVPSPARKAVEAPGPTRATGSVAPR